MTEIAGRSERKVRPVGRKAGHGKGRRWVVRERERIGTEVMMVRWRRTGRGGDREVCRRGRSGSGEVGKGSGKDGREWGSSWRGNAALERGEKLGMAEDGDESGGDGGAAVRRRRRLEDGGVAMTVEKNPWPGQGVAAVVKAAAAAARMRAAAAATTVGLLPRPSLRSHLRGRSLLSFFK